MSDNLTYNLEKRKEKKGQGLTDCLDFTQVSFEGKSRCSLAYVATRPSVEDTRSPKRYQGRRSQKETSIMRPSRDTGRRNNYHPLKYTAARKQAFHEPRNYGSETSESVRFETVPSESVQTESIPSGSAGAADDEGDVVMQDDSNEDLLKRDAKLFAAQAGKMQSLEQVRFASRWMTSRRVTVGDESSKAEDERKFAVLNAHVEKIGLQKAWPEIIMYRQLGQISTYYISGQSLRGSSRWEPSKNRDRINALDELEISAVGWSKVAAREGGLSSIERLAGVENGGTYRSPAVRLKAFMAKYKALHVFTEWNWNHMVNVRWSIYEIVEEIEGERQQELEDEEHRLNENPPGKSK